MVAEWPISLSEAAERLGLASSTVGMVVNIKQIPIRRLGPAKCIDEAGFRKLQEEIKKLPGGPNSKGRRKAAAVS